MRSANTHGAGENRIHSPNACTYICFSHFQFCDDILCTGVRVHAPNNCARACASASISGSLIRNREKSPYAVRLIVHSKTHSGHKLAHARIGPSAHLLAHAHTSYISLLIRAGAHICIPTLPLYAHVCMNPCEQYVHIPERLCSAAVSTEYSHRFLLISYLPALPHSWGEMYINECTRFISPCPLLC